MIHLKRARAAYASAEAWDQTRADEVVRAVGRACYRADLTERMAQLVAEQTGMGNATDLATLHRVRVLGTMRDLHNRRTVGVVSHDEDRRLTTWAKPLGVVAVVAPATAPCTAVATSVLSLLKTRNAAVVSAHPKTTLAVAELVNAIRTALRAVGADEDLVQLLDRADRDGSVELMRGADFVIATGGAATVARAYGSGTPTVSSGPGNATVIVDEFADLAAAASLIATGASFNHGTSCSSESNALVHPDRLTQFTACLETHGAYVLPDVDGLERVLRNLAGRPAGEIARACGVDLSERPDRPVRTLVAVLPAPAPGRLLFAEKLAPVLTVAPYHSFTSAVRDVQAILDHSGAGHSCALHTGTGPLAEERVAQLASGVRACRIMVNQSTMGNAGSFHNGMEFTSVVSTGTWGGCGLSENVSWRHLFNRTTVSHPIDTRVPSEAELFGT